MATHLIQNDEPTPKINQRVPSVSLQDAQVPDHLMEHYRQRRLAGEFLSKAASWGEYLEKYRQEKTVNANKLPKVDRITRGRSYMWRKKESEFNPVLQQYTDRQKEEQIRRKEAKMFLKTAAPTHDLSKSVLQGWGHRDLRTSKTAEQDITAHIPRKPHFTDQCPTDRDSLFGKNKRLIMQYRQRSDFNPITLEYHTNDDRRKAEERKQEEMRIQEKHKQYRRVHFDPLAQIFRDPDVDKQFQEKQDQRWNMMRQQKVRSAPPHARDRAESAAYDPISLQVRDPAKVDSLERTLLVPLARFSRNKDKLRRYLNYEKSTAERTKMRREMNRSNVFKMREFHQSDFHVLQSKPFSGADSVNPIIPLEHLETGSDIWNGIERKAKWRRRIQPVEEEKLRFLGRNIRSYQHEIRQPLLRQLGELTQSRAQQQQCDQEIGPQHTSLPMEPIHLPSQSRRRPREVRTGGFRSAMLAG